MFIDSGDFRTCFSDCMNNCMQFHACMQACFVTSLSGFCTYFRFLFKVIDSKDFRTLLSDCMNNCIQFHACMQGCYATFLLSFCTYFRFLFKVIDSEDFTSSVPKVKIVFSLFIEEKSIFTFGIEEVELYSQTARIPACNFMHAFMLVM